MAVAADIYASAQEGWLSRPPEYDGVSYLVYARAPLLLIQALHVKTGLHDLFASISPLWVSLLTAQQLIAGAGIWQAFAARFWAVALLLVLVYWIVSRRATRPLAIAAVVLTALLPMVSVGMRASSWEFLSGQADYYDHWWLDDTRPDFLTIALILWSVAIIAEHIRAPRRSAYLISAAFAAIAVLNKSSTVPVTLAAWGLALVIAWLWNRRSRETTRMTLEAAILLSVLLAPWAVLGGGVLTVVTYLKNIMAFKTAYASSGGLVGGLTYYPLRLPAQLGEIEAWVVVAGVAVLTIALLRRRLGPSEMIYAALIPVFYIVFTQLPSKNPFVGEWFSLSVWVFFLAGLARLTAARWPLPMKRAAPVALSAVAVYTLVIFALGAVALANWPLNEQRANAQLLAVTSDVAQELGRHVSAGECFTYLPGPGWPASLIYTLIDSNGNAPASTAIDVDPTRTTINDYVAAAQQCQAVMAYREDLATVAQVFFAPPVRQPYLRAVAEWVRSPGSGFVLDKTWTFSDLPPMGPHTLGHYQGISLSVDLYLRRSGA